MNFTDVTANAELFRAIFQSMPVPSLILNAAGRVIAANRQFHTLTGFSVEAMRNVLIEDLVQFGDHAVDPHNRERLMRVLQSKIAGTDTDPALLHKDGSRIPVRISISSDEAQSGKVYTCTFTDRTSQIAEVRELQRKVRDLENRNLELSRFAYGASHDLKAPLASIMGLLSLCIEDLNDGAIDDVRENLDRSLMLCKRGAGRIDAIFEVTRVGEMSFPIEEIRLESLIREIWHEQDDDNAVRSELLLDAGHTGTVRYERPTLRVILENLISNAFRFRDPEKSSLIVKIRTETKDDTVRISVADNGVGIPENRHRDVFTMFRQINERSGNGLGMALTKRHVERLNGKVEFRSVEREGSEFTVTLPVDPMPKP